jgi:superfamily II DNA or RNA helicase
VKLRDYQTAAVDSALRDFETVQSSLIVMPTGTGKSPTFAEIIKRLVTSDAGAIVLAHREELLTQAQRTIEAHTGLQCEYELGDRHASEIFPAPVLLASVQTMTSGRNGSRRMHKFSPYNYGLVVVDEAHHGTAASYKAVLDYFKSNVDLKILGVTATPERSDEQALGQLFQSVAFDYSIRQAIHDGWLVPVQQQLVDIQSLDFSHVRTTAGDLNASDLSAVMESESNLYGVCDATIRELGEKRAIMFTVSVKQAEMAANILNRYKAGVANYASGGTPKEDRRKIMRDFHEGRFQILVNCNLVSEGFDVPDAELLIQARPTKSKLLYQQQLGRIMRPLPGTVDFESVHVDTLDAVTRRDAIAKSRKPLATVMDFVGNAGRHKLVHAVDVLGGKISERVRELAERELRKTGRPEPIDELVAEAERKEDDERLRAEAARKAKLTARATYTMRTIDPFDAFDIVAPPTRDWDRGKSLTTKQRELMRRQGIDPDALSYTAGKTLLNEMFRRWDAKLCSLKQANLLKKHGYDTRELSREKASELIDALSKNGWKRP